MRMAESADGTGIAWAGFGNAAHPPIVLAHSLGLNSSMWASQVEDLADRFHVIVFDMRGHGRSEVPPPPYSIESLGVDLIAVIDAAQQARVHLCGISLGGHLTLWMAVNHPDRLISAVPCNTSAKVGTVESWEERIAAVLEHGITGVAETTATRWFSPGFSERHTDRYEAAVATLRSTEAKGYIGCSAALAHSDLRASMGAIDLPVHVVGGEQDVSTPPSEATWIHERVAGSQLTIFENSAHLTNIERPEAFTSLVADFVGSVGK